jgi:hypothetical protein
MGVGFCFQMAIGSRLELARGGVRRFCRGLRDEEKNSRLCSRNHFLLAHVQALRDDAPDILPGRVLPFRRGGLHCRMLLRTLGLRSRMPATEHQSSWEERDDAKSGNPNHRLPRAPSEPPGGKKQHTSPREPSVRVCERCSYDRNCPATHFNSKPTGQALEVGPTFALESASKT